MTSMHIGELLALLNYSRTFSLKRRWLCSVPHEEVFGSGFVRLCGNAVRKNLSLRGDEEYKYDVEGLESLLVV